MQKGQVVRISGRWYVRFREKRNVNGTIEQKRVSHCLGPVTTRGKHPPADIKEAAAVFMSTVTQNAIPSERVVTIGNFVDRVYLPWVKERKRPSTATNYVAIWNIHLKPVCADAWLKNTRTYDVQGWLNAVDPELSKSTHKHVKNLLSAIFKLAKTQGPLMVRIPLLTAP